MARIDPVTGGPSFQLDADTSSSSSSSSSFFSDQDLSFDQNSLELSTSSNQSPSFKSPLGTSSAMSSLNLQEDFSTPQNNLSKASFGKPKQTMDKMNHHKNMKTHAAYNNIQIQPTFGYLSYYNESLFYLPSQYWEHLYPHQQQGVKWLANKNLKKEGCMLCDEMGLGKTIQSCGLLGGLFTTGSAQLALVVVPKGCLKSWHNELQSSFQRISEGVTAENKHGVNQKSIHVLIETISASQPAEYRRRIIQNICDDVRNNVRIKEMEKAGRDSDFRSCAVLLCPYSLVHTLSSKCSEVGGGWDVVILDEGHRIKNIETVTAKAARIIPTRWRLLLTGTPIQNNLKELWALLSFLDAPLTIKAQYNHVYQRSNGKAGGGVRSTNWYHGTQKDEPEDENREENAMMKLLDGDMETVMLFRSWLNFSAGFSKPIEAARCRDATEYEKECGNLAALKLQSVLSQRMIQRTKTDMNENTKYYNKKIERAEDHTCPRSSDKSANHGGNSSCSSNDVICVDMEEEEEEEEDVLVRTVSKGFAVAEELPPKHEIVLWVGLSKMQRATYEAFLLCGMVCALKKGTYEKSPLAALTFVMKLSNHVALANHKYLKVNANSDDEEDEDDDEDEDNELLDEDNKSKTFKHLKIRSKPDSKADEFVEDANFECTEVDWSDTFKLPCIPNTTQEDKELRRSHSNQRKNRTITCNAGGGIGVRFRVSAEELLEGSSKLCVLLPLLEHLTEQGHRVLIFSKYKRALDVIDHCLAPEQGACKHDYQVLRLDGTVDQAERQRRISRFNSSQGSVFENDERSKLGKLRVFNNSMVMLISTGVGSLGLTLTNADRVILFNPSWNPTEDAQAVDRAHRIGQTKQVVTYRLIGAGTVEAKVYEKQVFKDGLRRTLSGVNKNGEDEDDDDYSPIQNGTPKEHKRYFSKAELKKVFTLTPPQDCETLRNMITHHGTIERWIKRKSKHALDLIDENTDDDDNDDDDDDDDDDDKVDCSELISDVRYVKDLMKSPESFLINTTSHDALYSVLDNGEKNVEETIAIDDSDSEDEEQFDLLNMNNDGDGDVHGGAGRDHSPSPIRLHQSTSLPMLPPAATIAERIEREHEIVKLQMQPGSKKLKTHALGSPCTSPTTNQPSTQTTPGHSPFSGLSISPISAQTPSSSSSSSSSSSYPPAATTTRPTVASISVDVKPNLSESDQFWERCNNNEVFEILSSDDEEENNKDKFVIGVEEGSDDPPANEDVVHNVNCELDSQHQTEQEPQHQNVLLQHAEAQQTTPSEQGVVQQQQLRQQQQQWIQHWQQRQLQAQSRPPITMPPPSSLPPTVQNTLQAATRPLSSLGSAEAASYYDFFNQAVLLINYASLDQDSTTRSALYQQALINCNQALMLADDQIQLHVMIAMLFRMMG